MAVGRAEVWEQQLVEQLLSASSDELAAEPELGRLVSLGLAQAEDATRERFRDLVVHDLLLVRLIGAFTHEVRGDYGRRLQLRWDHLVELLGSELLIRRVQELPAAIDDTDDDTQHMLRQARRYAADPEEADRELERYRAEYGS